MKIHILIGVILALFIAKQAQTISQPFKPSSLDESSFANIDVVRQLDMEWDIYIDFGMKRIIGSNTIMFKALQDTSEIVLDYKDLNITDVVRVTNYFKDENEYPVFYERYTDQYLGSAIRIFLTDKAIKGTDVYIRIKYSTLPESESISWLTPEMTFSNTLPFMYSICEKNQCRSLLPIQDTPAAKFTIEGTLTVLNPYLPWMSGGNSRMVQNNTHNSRTFRFEDPIPSYLIAIEAGNITWDMITFQSRPFVYISGDPMILPKAVEIFNDLTLMLNQSIDYFNSTMNPFPWSYYSLAIQPPSFPLGGVENPGLTFTSPTLLLADRSLNYFAMHEIVHSWTGNLVTCRDWQNVWLNEGFTVFIERKLSSINHGEEFSKTEAHLGNTSLFTDLDNLGYNNSYSSLLPDFNGRSPDESSSQVLYEKGFQFLVYLESLMLDPNDFQKVIQQYVYTYAKQSVIYIHFRLIFNEWIQNNYNSTVVQDIQSKVDWDAWITKPGPPPVTLNFSSPSIIEIENLADEYINLRGFSSPDNITSYTNTTNINLKIIFINRLTARFSELDYQMIYKIDNDLNITHDINPEIGQRWYPLTIRANYRSSFDSAHHYVSTIGRQRYILPVYQALVKYGYRYLAYDWFVENMDKYHPETTMKIRKILN